MFSEPSSCNPQVRRFLPSRRWPLYLVIGALAMMGAAGAWWMGERFRHQSESLGSVSDRVGRNAPFITSPDPVVDRMIEMADLKPGDLALDLGCGDGRIIITAARKTGCRGIGYDIDPQRVAEARENVKLHGVEHLVEIRQQDIFTADLREADVVLMYVLPWMTRKLIPQLRQLQPGARIVSHQFMLGEEPELKPEETIQLQVIGDSSSHYVHRWTTPLQAVPNVR
jgi:SAM-dependent methyltransferase